MLSLHRLSSPNYIVGEASLRTSKGEAIRHMRVSKITVRNFRSVLEEMEEFDFLIALVGRNGSGKSTLLRALELFFAPTPKFDLHDVYADNVNQEIEIELTFSNLRPEEQIRF